MAVEFLGTNASDGTTLGRTATELISFYGATPIVQPVAITNPATTVSVSTAGIFGFTTSTQANAISNGLRQVIDSLEALGIIAT